MKNKIHFQQPRRLYYYETMKNYEKEISESYLEPLMGAS